MKLFNALGLDPQILIAQLVNFAVLVFVLYKFAYNPILNFLKQRKEKIKQGVEYADQAEKELEEARQEKKGIIKEAKKEAMTITEKAKEEGEEKRKKIVDNAKEEVGQIINQEKEKIRAEKAESLKEAKKEVADMVVLALEKVLEEKVDSKKDKDLIQKTIKEIK